jgi:hypothetical protein
MKYILLISGLVCLIIACSSTKETKSRYRRIQKESAIQFHKPVELKIGWYPYNERKMERTGNNVWSISPSDSADRKGMIPVIHVKNPETDSTLWVYMDIDNELLGKLIKHSLMTEVPIEFPLTEYLEKADCQKCHPQHIEID